MIKPPTKEKIDDERREGIMRSVESEAARQRSERYFRTKRWFPNFRISFELGPISTHATLFYVHPESLRIDWAAIRIRIWKWKGELALYFNA